MKTQDVGVDQFSACGRLRPNMRSTGYSGQFPAPILPVPLYIVAKITKIGVDDKSCRMSTGNCAYLVLCPLGENAISWVNRANHRSCEPDPSANYRSFEPNAVHRLYAGVLFFGGGQTRTVDLSVMSRMSYHCSTPLKQRYHKPA